MKNQTKLITGIAVLIAMLHPRRMKSRRQSTQPSPIASPLRTMFSLAVAGGLAVQMTPGIAQAQTHTVIKNFGIQSKATGSNPRAPLVQGPDGTLYGTASGGEGHGTVFKIQPDGTGFAVLKYFTNSVKWASPHAGLVLSGDTLYGTTFGTAQLGNTSGYGTVFKVNTNTYGSVTSSVAALTVQLPTPIVLTADGSGSFIANGFRFNLNGIAGQTVVIEASRNLTSWTPLLTNSLPTGHFHFNDPDSTNVAQRFYRARLTP